MVEDLKTFLERVNNDKALQNKMVNVIKGATEENVFAKCNAVAADMGYNITEDDLQTYADEYGADLNDAELDKVAGGTLAEVVSSLLVLSPNVAASVCSIIALSKRSKE